MITVHVAVSLTRLGARPELGCVGPTSGTLTLSPRVSRVKGQREDQKDSKVSSLKMVARKRSSGSPAHPCRALELLPPLGETGSTRQSWTWSGQPFHPSVHTPQKCTHTWPTDMPSNVLSSSIRNSSKLDRSQIPTNSRTDKHAVVDASVGYGWVLQT